MTWNSLMGSGSALHIESGEKFTVNYYSKNVQTIDDFGIAPIPGSGKKWSSEELLRLKQELWEHWKNEQENERRRRELSSLINQKFFGENWRAADAIASLTGKRISARSLQSWMIDSHKPSSRKCPAWALKALQNYLDDPKNAQHLEEIAKFRSDYPKEYNHIEEIHDKRGVELATHAIEWDHRALERWRKADFNTLPIKLFELEKRIDGYLSDLGASLAVVTNALDQCENFEDFKEVVKKKLREADSVKFELQSVRKSIETNTDEFSNEEGSN
jgi:hypothetical protein